MGQIYRITAMSPKDWKLPLNIAIGIHVLVLLGAIYLPGIFKAKPKFADIYTVSIINVAEPAASAPSTPPPARVKKTSPPAATAPPTPKKAQKTAPIAEAKEEKAAPAPPKSISLKPLKKKVIQKTKPQEDLARKQEIARKNRQRLAEALREEELLAEKAKLAQEALEVERKLLQTQSLANDLPTRSTADSENSSSTSASTTGGSSNLIESQYLAAIFNRLHQFWTPPEYLQQNPDLTTVVVITINQDGKIANTLVESKSGDRVFDQFVNKTIEEADPMPPIPPALKKQRFEIGLRFRPGSIQ